jgi:LemA protein
MNPELIAGTFGAGVFLLFVIVIYNRLVRLRYAVRSSWSDVDVHLRKRYELVPNLVETVKAYASHERETLTRVTDMRSVAMSARTPSQRARAETGLTDQLRSLFALVEAYPGLKADAHFHDLLKQLREIEDAIEYARRYYNANVRDYNIGIGLFPSNLVAGAFAFDTEEFFNLGGDGRERQAVKVAFTPRRTAT